MMFFKTHLCVQLKKLAITVSHCYVDNWYLDGSSEYLKYLKKVSDDKHEQIVEMTPTMASIASV